MLGFMPKKFSLKKYIEMKRLTKEAEEYSKDPKKKPSKKAYLEDQKRY